MLSAGSKAHVPPVYLFFREHPTHLYPVAVLRSGQNFHKSQLPTWIQAPPSNRPVNPFLPVEMAFNFCSSWGIR